MKKVLFVGFVSLICSPLFGQWVSNGSTISTTQNVGIGTTTPGYKLDVNGDMKSGNIVLPNGNRITRHLGDNFTYQGLPIGHYSFGWMSDPWYKTAGTLWQSGYGGIKFFTQGTYQMGIDVNGNIGVGTETPKYKLDVNGDFRSSNIVLLGGNRITKDLKDNFTYKGLPIGHYSFGWMSDPWYTKASTLWQSGFGGIKFFTQGIYRMGIDVNGNIGIGTETPTHKLDVDGNIRGKNFYANGTVFANEVKVETTKWSDFVFDKDYKLLPLEEVKAHIEEHKHLPDIPSEKQVIEEGINVAEMQAKLLQKIEELTLYVIELKEENKLIREENQQIQQKLQDL